MIECNRRHFININITSKFFIFNNSQQVRDNRDLMRMFGDIFWFNTKHQCPTFDQRHSEHPSEKSTLHYEALLMILVCLFLTVSTEKVC